MRGSLPKNTKKMESRCSYSDKNAFFGSSFAHCRRIYSTVSGLPHLSHLGGAAPYKKCTWVLYVCPILNLQSATSAWRVSGVSGKLPSSVLAMCSLFCVWLSHKYCSRHLSVFLREGLRSSTDIFLVMSGPSACTDMASWSVSSSPTISQWPETQRATTLCWDEWMAHSSE